MFSTSKLDYWLVAADLYFPFQKAVEMVKKTPAYKNRLRALELERSGGVSNKKKNNKIDR